VLLADFATRKSMFKFNDYYYSTERYSFPVAGSIEEALRISPPPLPENFEKMRKELLESFPYDLWE
jgi:pyruvyltransferase